LLDDDPLETPSRGHISHCWPKGFACSVSMDRRRYARFLARRAATQRVGFNDWQIVDVAVAGDVRPMFNQHAPTEWIDLAKRDGLERA
jgi:phospholipase C